MSTPVRLAVIGAGLVGRRHIDAIGQTAGVELAAVADSDPGAAAVAAAAGAEFHASLSELLAAGARVDGILLATPNALHVEQGLECIAAGRPLLVEKPLALTSADAARLVDAARRAGVPLLVGHHRRHNPLIHRAKAVLDDGRLGRLRTLHASCWLYKPDAYFDVAPWRKAPGAGPVFVNLIHDVDLLRYFAGEVASVQAQTVASLRGHANEDVAGALLRFASGAIATLTVSDAVVAPWSWEMTAAENPDFPFTGQSCYWLGGTRAALSLPDLTLWRQDEPDWCRPLTPESIAVERRDPLQCQLEHFAAVIRGDAEPLVSGEEGAASLRVIEAIHESAESGGTVKIG